MPDSQAEQIKTKWHAAVTIANLYWIASGLAMCYHHRFILKTWSS